MSTEPKSVPEIVPLGLLRRYLLANGWHLAETNSLHTPMDLPADPNSPVRAFLESRAGGKRNIDVFVLSGDGSENVELVLPRDRSVSDFDDRLQGAISTLSQLEDRERDQVLASVRSIGFDVV